MRQRAAAHLHAGRVSGVGYLRPVDQVSIQVHRVQWQLIRRFVILGAGLVIIVIRVTTHHKFPRRDGDQFRLAVLNHRQVEGKCIFLGSLGLQACRHESQHIHPIANANNHPSICLIII